MIMLKTEGTHVEPERSEGSMERLRASKSRGNLVNGLS